MEPNSTSDSHADPHADPIRVLPVSAALRSTVAAMARADQADGATDSAEARERMLRTAERPVWMARDTDRTAFVHEIGAYTRQLRADGMSLKRVLAAVTAELHAIAQPLLDERELDALVHDGGRASVEAYFER